MNTVEPMPISPCPSPVCRLTPSVGKELIDKLEGADLNVYWLECECGYRSPSTYDRAEAIRLHNLICTHPHNGLCVDCDDSGRPSPASSSAAAEAAKEITALFDREAFVPGYRLETIEAIISKRRPAPMAAQNSIAYNTLEAFIAGGDELGMVSEETAMKALTVLLHALPTMDPNARPLGLKWGRHDGRGDYHIEWHAPCGCAYHPEPTPHVHTCIKHSPIEESPAIGQGGAREAAEDAWLLELAKSGEWIAAEDINRLVRELDVAMNGEGAAKQASLCDIVGQLKAHIEQAKLFPPEPEDADVMGAREAAREIVHFLCANESSFKSVSAWTGERCEQQLTAIISKHFSGQAGGEATREEK